MPLLYEREEVQDWVDCDDFLPKPTLSQDIESFTASSPAKILNDTSPWHAECFDKVRLSESSDKSINEQPVSLIERAPNSINNVCLALESTEGNNSIIGVAADSKNCHIQGRGDQTPPENIQTEGSKNQGRMEMATNFPGQGNNNIITIAQVAENTQKPVSNATTKDDTVMYSNDDDKENKAEFNYGHQENKNLGESSGQLLRIHYIVCYTLLNTRKY